MPAYWLLALSAFLMLSAVTMPSSPADAEIRDTAMEEVTCKDIGFKPRTEAFGRCVLELISRSNSTAQPNSKTERRQAQRPASEQPASSLSPDEQTCTRYGFKPRTQPFAQCLMQIDQAKRDAQIAQQQYEMQLAQYQQQMAAYQVQQDAIKKEKDRRKWEMLGRLGAGMANSTSPSFLGALNEGLAAANGVPIAQPVAPSVPRPRTHTMVLPNGSVITCTTTGSVTNCF